MRPITGIAASLICMASSISSAATYPDGFTWQRSSDYTPGTVRGSVLGNPNLDSEGSVVWQMGWVGYGNLLGQSNPWYEATPTLSVHDGSWYSQPLTAWTRGDDTGAYIGPTLIQQGLNNGSGGFLPIVHWINPVATPFMVDIEGAIQLDWLGVSGGPNTDVDVIIAQVDSLNAFSPLYSMTFIKPTPDTSFETTGPVPISILGVSVEPGDSILISLQSRTQGLTSNWLDLTDSLTMEVVADPSVPSINSFGIAILFLLIGICGFAAVSKSRLGFGR